MINDVEDMLTLKFVTFHRFTSKEHHLKAQTDYTEFFELRAHN